MSSTRLSAYCSKVIEAGWIAAVVLIPLYFNVYSSRVFEPDKLTLLRSIAVFMGVAWLVKTIEEASHKRRVFNINWRTPLVLPTLALVVIYLFTTLTSVTPFTSLWGSYQRLQGTYTTLAYIVVFFLILNEMRSREQLDRLITAAIVTSVPISLYGLIQHYGIDPLPWGGDVTTRVASNMGNAIFIAAYEIMIFFLTLGRIIESFIAILTEEEASIADILRASAYIFVALIQLITIYFSQSRGPWIGLAVGIFAFALFGLLNLRQAAADKGAMSGDDLLRALFAVGGLALVNAVVGLGLATLAQSAGVAKGIDRSTLRLTGIVIGAIFGGAAQYLLLLAFRRTWKWLWLGWVMEAALVIGFFILFNLPNSPLEPLRDIPYIGRLGRVFETERGTGKVRVLIWEGAVDMVTPHEPLGYPPEDPEQPFKEDRLNFLRPLIGYGPESMYVAYNPFYPSDLAHYEKRNASPDRSHNETFDALVITGVVGLVGYMVLFGSVFYYGLKWLGWINDQRQRNIWLSLFVGFGVLGAVGLMVWQGANFFGVGLPFGMALGMVAYLVVYASYLYKPSEEPVFVFEEKVWNPIDQQRIRRAVKLFVVRILVLLPLGIVGTILSTPESFDSFVVVGIGPGLLLPVILARALWEGSEGARKWILLSTLLGILSYVLSFIGILWAVIGGQAGEVLSWQTPLTAVDMGFQVALCVMLWKACGKVAVHTEEQMTQKEEQKQVERQVVGSREIFLVALVSAVIAHFVEIHFGIAIAATRTYFWVFIALLVLLGTGMLKQPHETAEEKPEPARGEPDRTISRSRRKRRRRSRRPLPQQRPQPARHGMPRWLGPVLVSAFILTLIMGTLGFNFITNAGDISPYPDSKRTDTNTDADCDGQTMRMLQPCWVSKTWEIVKHDLTVLPARGKTRPEEQNTFMTLGLFVLTLLIGGVVTLSEMSRRGLFKRRQEDWGWGTLLLLSAAILLTLIVLFSVADRHLQRIVLEGDAQQAAQRLQEAQLAGVLDKVFEALAGVVEAYLRVSMYLSSVLEAFYIFVFLFILVTALTLLIGRRLPQHWSTPWGLMAGIPLFFLAVVVMNETNIKVIRADIIYKQGEALAQQKQWDLAIAHHKRALEYAPNEDFYYLWAGSAYLEKSKSALLESCIITVEPKISAVLSASVEETAKMCREDLLKSARTILLQARHVNALNTDHTANLGRLYKNWADLSKVPEQRTERIDQSIGYYEQASRLSPQNTIVWNELATVYLYQKGDSVKAQEVISHSLGLDDRFDQTHLIQGDTWLTKAEALRRELVAKQKEMASADVVKPLEAEWKQALNSAIASYQNALELNPRMTNVYATIAGAYEQMGRLEDALEAFQKAAEANPQSGEPHIGLAELYQRLGDMESAVLAYRRAINLNPNKADYHIALASLLERMGRVEEALPEVQEAVRLKPNNAEWRLSLAFMYQRFKMYNEALAEARAAAQLAPQNHMPQLLIGDVSRELGDLEAAAGAYEQALAISPNLDNAWNVHLNLALIYQQLGRLEEALGHATTALGIAPEDQRQQINNFVVQLETQNAGNP